MSEIYYPGAPAAPRPESPRQPDLDLQVLDRYLRPVKDRVLHPVALRMERWTPNQISVASLLTGLAAAAFAASQAYGWAFACWMASRICDGLDGVVARTQHRQSDFGGYLDILLDFVVYAAIPLGLVVGAPTPANLLAGCTLLASFYVNAASWMYLAATLEKRAAGARAHDEQTSVTMPGGLMGGSETIIFFSLFLLLPGRMAGLFGVMSALVAFTVVQRLVWARRSL